ncbi:MAG: 50S ribosomal protein L17 [Bacteroidales bacterium]|nr:50S ribosomal protein L17 [Bacteroidales bacterium]
MRHGKKFNHLSRTHSHRKAMLANMATSLILKKRIKTTVAKAKALRGFVEPLITKSKEDSTHSRRMVFSHLQSKEAVTELFREISAKVMDRPGGYTRIFKTGNRLGDNAEMCIMELVDYNETMLAEKADKKPKKKRTRRAGTKKQIEEQVAETTVVEEKAETPNAEKKVEPKAEVKKEEQLDEKKQAPKVETKDVEKKAEQPEDNKKEDK